MGLKTVRFLSLLFTALALGPSLAHLLELPSKINLSAEDYLTVQQIYRGRALLGIVWAGALISNVVLTIMIRKEPKAFYLEPNSLPLYCRNECSVFLCLLIRPTSKQTIGQCCPQTGWSFVISGSTLTPPAQV
jgi:hypothetical protein